MTTQESQQPFAPLWARARDGVSRRRFPGQHWVEPTAREAAQALHSPNWIAQPLTAGARHLLCEWCASGGPSALSEDCTEHFSETGPWMRDLELLAGGAHLMIEVAAPTGADGPVVAVDALALAGQDLRGLPYAQRLVHLERQFEAHPPAGPLQLPVPLPPRPKRVTVRTLLAAQPDSEVLLHDLSAAHHAGYGDGHPTVLRLRRCPLALARIWRDHRVGHADRITLAMEGAPHRPLVTVGAMAGGQELALRDGAAAWITYAAWDAKTRRLSQPRYVATGAAALDEYTLERSLHRLRPSGSNWEALVEAGPPELRWPVVTPSRFAVAL